MPLIPITAEISHLSRQWLDVPIGLLSFADGSPVNPDDDAFPADMAFTNIGTDPETGDWNSADYFWDEHRWAVRCLVGPGGGATVATGVHDVWIRATRGDEEVIARASGRLRVF